MLGVPYTVMRARHAIDKSLLAALILEQLGVNSQVHKALLIDYQARVGALDLPKPLGRQPLPPYISQAPIKYLDRGAFNMARTSKAQGVNLAERGGRFCSSRHSGLDIEDNRRGGFAFLQNNRRGVDRVGSIGRPSYAPT